MRRKDWEGRWAGRTVACVASGPSLTREDCDALHEASLPAIVTNTSFRMAPWADVLFAFDAAWLKAYHAELVRDFRGLIISAAVETSVRRYGAESIHGQQAVVHHYGNSGSAALALAVASGARRVLLLGYDCRRAPDGRAHWHEPHQKPLNDPRTMEMWPRQFAQIAGHARTMRCEVVNCSRVTALTCFPRVALEDELEQQSACCG